MVARLLFDLARQDCRWPVGTDSDTTLTLFCAEPVAPSKPYCSRHARLAFNPRPPRRRRPKRVAAAYVPVPGDIATAVGRSCNRK
jgi:hypothetical protein